MYTGGRHWSVAFYLHRGEVRKQFENNTSVLHLKEISAHANFFVQSETARRCVHLQY